MAHSVGSSVLGILQIFGVLVALSLTLFAYKRALTPLYGDVATSKHLTPAFMAALAVPVITPRLPSSKAFLLFALLLCFSASSSYWVAALTARLGEPVLGSLATHAVVLVPIVYAASSFAMNINVSASRGQPSVVDRMIVLQASYSLTTMAAQYGWPTITSPGVTENKILLTVGGSALALWSLANALGLADSAEASKEQPSSAPPREIRSKLKSKNKSKATSGNSTEKDSPKTPSNDGVFTARILLSGVLLPLLPAVLPYLGAPTLPQPLLEPYVHPTEPLRILSTVQSNTGLIVVAETQAPSHGANGTTLPFMRILRASHSMLGGVWIEGNIVTKDGRPTVTDAAGTALGESIYSAFVLQEGARLVSSTKKAREGNYKDALVIGLGTGIVASALSRHGLSTTIVEVDQAVYNASRDYFGLHDLSPKNVFIEDGRSWVYQRRMELERRKQKEGKYDIVIHDCFSGGGVPAHLFTTKFWEDLRAIMSPEGVVAVNFAGVLGSDPSKGIIHTLQRSFGQCRAFHDSMEKLTDEKLHSEFINLVFFCTPSRNPLTFRLASEADYLGSYLREHVLSSLPGREVDLSIVKGSTPESNSDQWVLTDIHNPLGVWQHPQALMHWRLMREILPHYFWETY